ncbi:hypothetical protein Tco_0537662 [Tanacetum coccineum]
MGFQVMYVLGVDAHAFTHFRDERKRRWVRLYFSAYLLVIEHAMDERLGRTVTRVMLPRVFMHSRHHYGTYTSENFTGLELEDGGGCGTSDVVSGLWLGFIMVDSYKMFENPPNAGRDILRVRLSLKA